MKVLCTCGKTLRVDDALAGNAVRCPACGGTLKADARVEEDRAEEEESSGPRRGEGRRRSPAGPARTPRRRPEDDLLDGDRKFPRWAGPLIGAIIGVLMGLRAMGRERLLDLAYPALGGLLGALGGGVLWLMDAPPARPRRPASTLGSILAALAVFPGMLLPFVGLLFGIPAFLVNRRVTSWQNKASRLGLGICIVITVVVAVASQVPLR